MDSSDIEPIDRFKNDIRYRDKIVHVETIPSKKAKYKKIDNLKMILGIGIKLSMWKLFLQKKPNIKKLTI